MRLLALTVCLLSSGPAVAGLSFCNETARPALVAIGYNADSEWVSEGWWSVAPDDCTRVIAGDLRNRFYYWHAVNDDGDFAAGEFTFCVQDEAFTITGDTGCADRGLREARFAELDVGAETEASVALTPVDAPRATPPAAAPQPQPAPATEPDLAALTDVLQGLWGDVADPAFATQVQGTRFMDFFDGVPVSTGTMTLQSTCEGNTDGPYLRVVHDDLPSTVLCWTLFRLNAEEFHFQAVGRDSIVRLKRR